MDIRIIIGAGSFLVGVGLGTLVTWQALKTRYADIAQDEIDSVKLHYARLFKEGEHGDLSGIVAKYKDVIDDNGYGESESNDAGEDVAEDPTPTTSEDRREAPPVVNNVWRTAQEHPEDEAYVITFDQFNDEHDDYDKGDLTYYEEDDTLVDSQESPVDDIFGLIGPDALTRFGDGSNDPNIVYVRNDRLSMDFEISIDKRSYTEHVLGIPSEKKRKTPKMRGEE